MAVNKIAVIHTGSKLHDRISYIQNSEKTAGGTLVAAFNCSTATAYEDMISTKLAFGKESGRQAYHLKQSFKPGEITPAKALKFGMEFVKRYLGDRYEVLVTVHTDRKHIHCHIIWNSVSYVDGLKYHAPTGHYLNEIRNMSDELCKELGYSVINQKSVKELQVEREYARYTGTRIEQGVTGQHYAAWLAENKGRETYRSLIRKDIDRAMLKSFALSQFYAAMREMGYDIKKDVKYISIRPAGKERFVRLKSLGTDYAEEAIHQRMIKLSLDERLKAKRAIAPMPEIKHFQYGSNKRLVSSIKLKGLRALYWRYVYLLRRVANYEQRPSSNRRTHFLLREDIRTLDSYIAQFKLINAHRIENLAQLHEYQDSVQWKMNELFKELRSLRHTRGATRDEDERAAFTEKIAALSGQMKPFRQELKLCRQIEERSTMLPERLAEIRRAEQEKKFKRIEHAQTRRYSDHTR
jgi:hypothetical protein